jgi:transcriptional regulator with XRE-family HTH domain
VVDRWLDVEASGGLRTVDIIASNIVRIRAEKSLSQDQVADAAGLQTASYSRVERGESDDVLLSTLEKIAVGLGVGVLELLDGIDAA